MCWSRVTRFIKSYNPTAAECAIDLGLIDGPVTASKQLDKPLATLEPAPLSGLSTPTFLLTVDYSTGMGGFSGPNSELLTPAERQLNPVEAINDHGQSAGTIDLGRNVAYRLANRSVTPGGTEEIEEVSCQPGRGQKTLQTYQTYRYEGGHWTVTYPSARRMRRDRSVPAPPRIPLMPFDYRARCASVATICSSIRGV